MTPYRGALVGFGFIAEHGHVPAYATLPRLYEIAAVADICPARRARAAELLPHARIYPDVETLLAAERQLSFVDIATPPCDHAAIAHAAFDHGLHVFCEKPIATTSAQARAMLDHAAAARRVLFPSHNYKHAPVLKVIRDVLDAGHLGAIRLVTLDTFRTTHARGVAEWQPDWRRSRAVSGGGIAMDHGSHTFYLAFDWLAALPTSITANMSNLSGHDTEDNFSCTLTFPTGIAVAQLTWNAGFRKVIYTIHGEHGALKVEDDVVEIHRPGTVDRVPAPSNWMDASHATWFRELFVELATAMQTALHVGREAVDAMACVEVIEAAYASARSGGHRVDLVRTPLVKAG
jgi:predicted dehydrogenase